MRRLVLEFSQRDVSIFRKNPSLQRIESLEVLTFLKETPEEVAMVCRIESKDPDFRIEDIFNERGDKVQLIELEEEGAYTYFIKTRPQYAPSVLDSASTGGYISTPYEIKDGKIKLTHLGTAKQTREFMRMFEQSSIRFRVASLTDARFPPSSPLRRLTEKQRRVLIMAYKLGYYDVPRRIKSEELARRLKIRSSTMVMHRRRAERRLLSEILKEA